jgi:DNA-directed RNA polymerase subunit L
MELKVVKQDDETLALEVVGETITVTNALRSELWEDDNVSEAAQIKEHPYLAQPKVFVKTSRGKPQTALDKAAERIIKQTEEFTEEFKKALKNNASK